MHPMAVKHNTRRWNLKRYAKKGYFKGRCCGICDPKWLVVIEPTNFVLSPLDSVQRCLLII